VADAAGYQSRLAQEQEFFKDREEIHNLPAIFDYWSNKYVRPKLQAIGFAGSIEFFTDPIQWQCEKNPGQTVRCLSLGSGNCDLEIQIASRLRARGHPGFKMECLDVNETTLERGLAAAAQHGIADNFTFTRGDFNVWLPDGEYDVILAIQSLHHVVELEHLFATVKEGLKAGGMFVVSDMIGRNGHLRWPEALSIVQEFWRKLPPSYRYNHQLGRYEEQFEDWDCSQEGFEGIRSQDILPLLNANFHFQRFLAFGNAIDPFVDRSFGHNFDASAEWDRAFIDEVHRRDEEELRKGTIKPTHLWAILGKHDRGPTLFEEPLSPSFCIRPPSPPGSSGSVTNSEPYAWDEFPHDRGRELKTACARLTAAERRIRGMAGELQTLQAASRQVTQLLEDRTAWARGLELEVQERTVWALKLDEALRERTEWALKLDKELRERTEWALKLDEELRERTEWALKLDQELRERTEWALRLDEALRARTEWALQLDREVKAGTVRVQELDDELRERTEWALQLDSELIALRKSLGRSGHAALRIVERFRSGVRRLRGRPPKGAE